MNSSPHRPLLAPAIVGLITLLTCVGVLISSAGDVQLVTPRSATATLTPAERNYFNYVAPRLDALVAETTAVQTMVKSKSRNVIRLESASTRISSLWHDIQTYGEATGVPERMQSIHTSIAQASTMAEASFKDAHDALRTFNFSRMRTLVPQFDRVVSLLGSAQTSLNQLAGVNSPASSPPPA